MYGNFDTMMRGFLQGFGPGAQANSLQGMYGQLNNVMGREMEGRRRLMREQRQRAYQMQLSRDEERAETERLLMRIQHEREMARQQRISADKARGVLHSSDWYR